MSLAPEMAAQVDVTNSLSVLLLALLNQAALFFLPEVKEGHHKICAGGIKMMTCNVSHIGCITMCK